MDRVGLYGLNRARVDSLVTPSWSDPMEDMWLAVRPDIGMFQPVTLSILLPVTERPRPLRLVWR